MLYLEHQTSNSLTRLRKTEKTVLVLKFASNYIRFGQYCFFYFGYCFPKLEQWFVIEREQINFTYETHSRIISRNKYVFIFIFCRAITAQEILNHLEITVSFYVNVGMYINMIILHTVVSGSVEGVVELY